MKTIMITGVTSGMGYATAQLFAGNGWQVIGTGRRRERLHALAEELGPRFLPLVFDVGIREQVERAFNAIPEPFAAVSVLVNNAGLFLGKGKTQHANPDDWERMIATNILGTLYCTRFALPGMLLRECGHIVNLSSSTATRPGPMGSVYGASKAFINSFSASLRADLLGTPVRVSCISPGRTRSEFSLVCCGGDAEAAEKDYSGGDPLQAADVAEAIWWVVNAPARMDVAQMEIMPSCQADGGSIFARGAKE